MFEFWVGDLMNGNMITAKAVNSCMILSKIKTIFIKKRKSRREERRMYKTGKNV